MPPVSRNFGRRLTTGRLAALAAVSIALVMAGSIAPAHAEAYEPGDTLVSSDATWSYWRDERAPSPTWNELGADSDSWPVGQAPFGYGSRLSDQSYRTRLLDLPDQVRTTYFRHEFEIDLSGQAPGLEFHTWADDGVVVYVNGVEIGRERVAAHREVIPHTWAWATSAPRTSPALAEELVFPVPAEVLRDGLNVISAAVLANWRTSFDVTFGGELVVAGDAGVQPVTPPADVEPIEGSILPVGDLVAPQQRWEFRREESGPAPAWKYSTSSLGWDRGVAPFGVGRVTTAATTVPIGAAPLSTYFRYVFSLAADHAALDRGATLTTWADDGAIVYVNGHEVGRHRVPWDVSGAHSETWATDAPSWRTAQADLVRFTVPSENLHAGENVIAVQVVSNYRGTTDISFDATLATAVGDQPAAHRTAPRDDWELVWSDEFNGTALNTSNWSAYNNSAYGDGNLESACLMDRPENLAVQDGHLYLTARYEVEPIQCGWGDTRYPDGRSYTSAQILSRDKIEFMYGRVEIRAQLPVGQGVSQGMWPAFWLRTSEGLGEIDILEALGSRPGDDWQAGIVYHSLHRETTNTLVSERSSYELPFGADMSDGFHTFALEWEPDELRFFVDDVMTARYTIQDTPWIAEAFTGKEFFIRLNLAVGGRWPGYVDSTTELPASYVIDYVRLYQER